MKPTLSLNKSDVSSMYNTLGMAELFGYLINSDLFDISFHEERVRAGKGERGGLLIYNNKRIYVDFWEYAMPTYTTEAYNANLDLIIKLQHCNQDPERFEHNCVRKGTFRALTKEQRLEYWKKIVPWTFFPSKMMKRFVGKEDEIKPIETKQLAFFCGKEWRCRHSMRDKLKKDGIEWLTSSQEWRTMRPLTDDQYLDKMMSSKYGLVLHGRGSHLTEGKNRREIDYMMLKKPLLLNYKPHYYNPLEAGKHYIFIDEKTDFKELDKMYNIDEIAANGYQWYKANASPMGSAQTFLKIMTDRFGQ